jgi:hypothetical protein
MRPAVLIDRSLFARVAGIQGYFRAKIDNDGKCMAYDHATIQVNHRY